MRARLGGNRIAAALDTSIATVERTRRQLLRKAKASSPVSFGGGAAFSTQPPAWCIETEKWPYQTQDWKDWLQFKRGNANPPLPNTAEWQAWREAYK